MTDTMTHRELEKLLEDSVDINVNTVQPPEPAGPAASSWRTAVSSRSYRNPEPVTVVAAPAPRIEAPASNDVPVFRNTAMMHAAASSSSPLSSARAPLHPLHQSQKSVGFNWKRNQPGLPTVNLKKTDKLFATLDEGCNSICHTVEFTEKARIVLSGYGRPFGEPEGDGTSYKGLGIDSI